MKNLIIIGAGGMGRTYYSNALQCKGYGTTFIIKGFIDDNLNALDRYPNYPPIIDQITEYTPEDGDVFVCSIGGVKRKDCIDKIISKGGEFIELIHKDAKLLTNVKLGKGNFIGAYTIIGNDVSIGNYNMIQSFTVIGHDAIIGDYNRIDSHVTCVGGIKIQDEVTIHTGAVINHNVTLEHNSKIGANSFVIRKVKEGETVLGVPAKRIDLT